MKLERDEVHCWCVKLDVSAETCAALAATLSRDERIRSARLRSPALTGRLSGLTFNLSHSGDRALVGIAADAQIGVDLEHIRDEPEFTEIAQWFFAAAESEELTRLPSELRARAFLSSWTRKEAYVKARGEGLGATNEMAHHAGWSVYSLQPAPGYVGALAVEGSGWRVIHRFVSLDAH